MALRNRLATLGILGAVAIACYGTAKHYSPAMVIFVVEQALLQKAPAALSPVVVTREYRELMESLPTRDDKLKRALVLSQYLEKVQRLSQTQFDELLRAAAQPGQ